jgi:hypothetical protein
MRHSDEHVPSIERMKNAYRDVVEKIEGKKSIQVELK